VTIVSSKSHVDTIVLINILQSGALW